MKEAVYLRKSQSDDPDEPLELTIAKHKKRIQKIIKTDNVDWFEEVVSADSITERPQIQKLLQLVSDGVYSRIYCIAIDRLCRGDSIDQGIIAQTIYYSGCLITTPEKTYDLANSETDRDMFDFSLFIAKREHNLIKKRLYNGKCDAVEAGYFVGSVTPFGFDKELDKVTKKNYILIHKPGEKEIVELIFNLFLDGMSKGLIANHLNTLDVKPKRANVWTPNIVGKILVNEAYKGILVWERHITIKKMVGNQVVKQRKRQTEYKRYKGKHIPIIDPDTFDKVQEIIKNNPLSKVVENKELKNPLSGLIECSCCSRIMQRRPYTKINNAERLKYKFDKAALSELLRNRKKELNLTRQEIADKLNVSFYLVESWFNKKVDKFFISKNFSDNWFKLKELLEITTNEYDEAVTTYEKQKPLIVLLCPLNTCDNVSCELKFVEDRLLEAILKRLQEQKYFLDNYEQEIKKIVRGNLKTIDNLNKKIDKKRIEYKNNYKNFNAGDVPREIYLEVKADLEEEISKLEIQKQELENNKQEDKIITYKKSIPILEECIKDYHLLDTVGKNKLLSAIVDKAIYTKAKKGTKTRKEDFELEIFFKL